MQRIKINKETCLVNEEMMKTQTQIKLKVKTTKDLENKGNKVI